MKKFLLTSCAILSAIGVQAQIVDFEYGGVDYEATLTSHRAVVVNDTTEEFGSTNETAVLAMDIHTITSNFNYYDASAVNVAKQPSATIATFEIYEAGTKSAYVGNTTTPQNYYSVGTAEYTQFFEDVKPELLGDSIKTYTELQSETGVTAYYYWEYDPAALSWRYVKATGIEDANLNRNGYYKRVVNGTIKIYFLIRQIGVAQRNATTTHRRDSCIVTKIEGVINNKTIQSITIGKDVNSIEEGAFYKDPKLNNFTLETEDNFIYENGILYNSDQTAIIVASCDVQSQTIPATVSYIYESAFYNTKNAISITSMNGALETNSGTQGSNVTFNKPTSTLTKVLTDNGGYIVANQNITQSNIDNLTIEGTFIDFRGSTVLEDIDITNVGNTLLYFATTANVTGNKNIINNNVCANCVITDNASDKFYCPSKFTATNLSYSRKFDALWRTATFPFSTNDATVNDQILTGEFRGYMEDYHLFNFVYSQSIVANRPYIIKTESDDENASFRFENLSDVTVEVTNPMQVKQGTNENPAYFYGNFDTKTLTSTDATFYYGITNTLNPQTGKYRNEVVKCVGATIKPFRAYLSGPATATANSAKIRLVDAMDQVIDEIEMPMTTGIEDVKTEEAITDNVYNLNGQSVKASRGLNIINGKVVINK